MRFTRIEAGVLTVVSWLYRGHGVKRDYGPEHVTRFQEQFSRWYSKPHRFVCITDMDGVDCDTVPMPESCVPLEKAYRKLWLFSREAAELIPGRVFFSDLDTDCYGPLDDLLDRDEPLVMWHDKMVPQFRYGTSHYLMDMGCRTDVWERFIADPEQAIAEMRAWFRERRITVVGSDQAWCSYYIEEAALFGPGIYRARCIRRLPADAKIVTYPGNTKPWHPDAKSRYRWLA